jgi:hypothetical protein
MRQIDMRDIDIVKKILKPINTIKSEGLLKRFNNMSKILFQKIEIYEIQK